MDKIDRDILHLLAQDASISATALSAELNLSVPAVNKRIAKLKAGKIIEKETILTNPKKVGKPVTAFVMIILDQFSKEDNVMAIVNSDRDIQECYAVTGEYDYILKICAADIDSLEEKILKLKKNGSAKTNTVFALMTRKYEPTVLPDEI